MGTPAEYAVPFSDTIQIETDEEKASSQFFAMDTVMGVTVYGEDAAEAVKRTADRIRDLENVFSVESGSSELHHLNEAGKAACSEDLLRAVSLSQQFYEDTNGLFNIALYPLKKAWGFADQNFRIPEEEEIRTLLSLADPMQAEIVSDAENDASAGTGTASESFALSESESTPESLAGSGIVYHLNGLQLDLGGMAKGYTADEAAKDLRKAKGVTGALLSLGGNIMLIGQKPDQKPWRVGILDPEGEQDYIALLAFEPAASSNDGLWAMSVVTSGGYMRYFEQDGKRYHHILDPRTGKPAESDIVSATIVSSDSALADAMSTTAFILGLKDAAEFWRECPYEFGMVLLDTEGVMHVTEELAGVLTTDCPLEVIRGRTAKRQAQT